jgi:hypothetical protein
MIQSIKQVRFPKALDSNGNEIRIGDAASGRKGYYCTGCKNEVEAVKPKIGKFQSYFRHVPRDVSFSISECTWSSETYRHKIAKETLQIEKSVRVPRLLKYPPLDFDGDPKLIQGPRTITAFRVDVEKSFYLNNNGELRYGPKTNESDFNGDKNFLIVPDVIFFNNLDQPILFIELVATHDIDDAKLAKILALKVDTIRIRLPSESPEAINECLKTGVRTKWIYSNEREQTNYHQLPGNFIQGVRGSDQDEAGVSYESSGCRKSRVRNLIRGIRRGLEADGFIGASESLKQQINSIERELIRRKAIEKKIEREVYEELRDRREKLQFKEEQLIRINNWVEERYKVFRGEIDLRRTRRDRERRAEIDKEQERINSLFARIRDRYERKGKDLEIEEEEFTNLLKHSEESTKSDGRVFIREQERIESEIIRVGNDIQTLRGKMESLQEDFESEERQLGDSFRRKEESLERNFKISAERETIIIEQLRKREEKLPRDFEFSRNEIAKRFERLEDETIKSVESENSRADTQLSRELKELVSYGKIFKNYIIVLATRERNRSALKFIGSEDFKTWYNSRRST